MSKFLDLTRHVETYPMPIIQPEESYAFTLLDRQAHGDGGEWAQVSCQMKRDIQFVELFLEQKTGKSGWICKTGSPYPTNAGWEWMMIQYG